MSACPPKRPKLSDKGRASKRERETRLAEALRANLRKRKTQSRGRRAGGKPGAPPESGEA
jgi:hypothetical protein